MKLVVDLELEEVYADGWSATIANIIKETVDTEIRRTITKQIKEAMKKNETKIANGIKMLADEKLSEVLKGLKV